MQPEYTEFAIKDNTANSTTKVIQVSMKMLLAATFNEELSNYLTLYHPSRSVI